MATIYGRLFRTRLVLPAGISQSIITRPTRAYSTERSLKEFSLSGKVAMVTGAARGLGNTFCKAFIEAGCDKVAVVDLNQENAQTSATALVEEYVKAGLVRKDEVTAIGFGCDVSSEDAIQRTVQDVESHLGGIDILVTAAGIVENFPAVEYPTSKIRKLYDINVHGSFFCAREVAKSMLNRQSKGSIILISSMSANIVNQPQLQTPYNASKAAVKHMATSLAVEWATKGVRVNALSPGYMMTKLTATILDENPELKVGNKGDLIAKVVSVADNLLQESWQTLTPMRRMGEPEELKGAIVFLASDASSYVTGSELRVDGGYCCV